MARELARMIGKLVLVLGGTALALSVLNQIPALIGGEPVGVIRLGSVAAAERRLGVRLLVPGYFPETLAWPPAKIEMVTTPEPTVLLTITDRSRTRVMVLIGQTGVGSRDLSPRLWPPGTVVHTTTAHLTQDGYEVVPLKLERVLTEDGTFWHQMSLDRGNRRLALRSVGSIDELVSMMRSLEHGKP